MTEPAAKPSPSQRTHERVSVDAEVILRRRGKINFRVRIYDLSPEGCRAEFVERPELDEHVWVRFEGMHSLERTICWIAGSKTRHALCPADPRRGVRTSARADPD
jgi:hypothetical protein